MILWFSVSSVYSTVLNGWDWAAAISPGSYPQQGGQEDEGSQKYKTWPEMIYTNATAVAAYFGNAVQAAELLGHLPIRFPPFPHKVFRDKERARDAEERCSKNHD